MMIARDLISLMKKNLSTLLRIRKMLEDKEKILIS